MLPEWVIKYVGGGIAIVLGYVIVSNTLWLLFGSRLIQSLPGVNIKGATGTLKIALMLVMSIIGFVVWLLRWPLYWARIIKVNELGLTISFFIQAASKVCAKMLSRN